MGDHANDYLNESVDPHWSAYDYEEEPEPPARMPPRRNLGISRVRCIRCKRRVLARKDGAYIVLRHHTNDAGTKCPQVRMTAT